jgi:methylmalonyl-CoA/ethylmalonyl-CoA epimerase
MQLATEIRHVGIVVRDIDRAIEHWQAIGAANFHKFYFSTSRGTCGKVYKNGRPHRIEAIMATGELGNLSIELAQPLDDKSVYADFLREHGEGLHHVCPDTDGTPFAEVCAYMEKTYGKPVFNGTGAISNFAYYDCRKDLGSFVEVFSKRTDLNN